MQHLTDEGELGMTAKRKKKSLPPKAFIVKKKRHRGVIDEVRELSKKQIRGLISHIREYRLHPAVSAGNIKGC